MGSSGPPGSGDWLLWCRGLRPLGLVASRKRQFPTAGLGPALVSTGVQMFQYRLDLGSVAV